MYKDLVDDLDATPMKRALQRPQPLEGLNMHLAITQAKEDASRVSGTLRKTMQIWISSPVV